MGKLIFGKTQYKNFGNCFTISNGLCELYVTTDVGPRIIKFNPIGKENIMFEDVERVMKKNKGTLAPIYGESDEWYIYGGHRFWISPEEWPVTYYPDNEKVDVQINGNTVVFTPPQQKTTGFCEQLSVTLSETSMTVTVKHILQNKSNENKECSIWAITVLSQNGICVIPQSQRNTGLLSNRTLMLWHYTDLQDKRFNLGNKYISLKQSATAQTSFKIGINNEEGKLWFFNHGYALEKSFTADHTNNRYPDNGCSCEIYTNKLFLEAETLGALQTLAPNQKASHTEVWKLYENVNAPELNEESAEKTIKSIIN